VGTSGGSLRNFPISEKQVPKNETASDAFLDLNRPFSAVSKPPPTLVMALRACELMSLDITRSQAPTCCVHQLLLPLEVRVVCPQWPLQDMGREHAFRGPQSALSDGRARGRHRAAACGVRTLSTVDSRTASAACPGAGASASRAVSTAIDADDDCAGLKSSAYLPAATSQPPSAKTASNAAVIVISALSS
jgi:hypothetical protein